MEDKLQRFATAIAPLYKRIAPEAYANQVRSRWSPFDFISIDPIDSPIFPDRSSSRRKPSIADWDCLTGDPSPESRPVSISAPTRTETYTI